jgi:hypothetical protein
MLSTPRLEAGGSHVAVLKGCIMRVLPAVALLLLSLRFSVSLHAPVDSRQPVPAADAVQAAETLMKEVFASELAKRSQSDMSALAARLLAEAAKNEADPASQYVLLGEARDRALRAGDAAAAIAATDQLAARYAVDGPALKLELLTRLKAVTLPAERLLAVLEYATALAEARCAADAYDQAAAALDHAAAYAIRSRTPKLVAEVNARRAQVKASAAGFAAFKAAQEKLAASPGDPQANLTAGQFLCLHKGQWDKGLEHLAASGDPAWSTAAKADLARPGGTPEVIKVGDLWWDLSVREPVATRSRLIQRSAGWYRLAQPSVTGLQQTKLNKRLEAFAATGLPPIPVNGEEVAAAPKEQQPWDKPAPAPWDRQSPAGSSAKPVARNDPLFGDSEATRPPPAADHRPARPRPESDARSEAASRGSSIFDETDDILDRTGPSPTASGRTTPPPAARAVRAMPDPADYRRVAARVRLQTRFSETIPRPHDGLDRHAYGTYVSQICGDIVSIEFFPVPKGTTIDLESQNWPLPTTYRAWVKMDFPDGFFGPGRHPEAGFDTAKHELNVMIWREDGDMLPDPDWIFRRFVSEVPPGCAADPARAVHLLRRWLDLYHDDATQKRSIDRCYARISAAYAAGGSHSGLPALLDAEAKLDRGPRSAFAILVERARHAGHLYKDTAKAAELFEQARALARAQAPREPYFRNRIALIDFHLGKLFFSSDKARALKHARAFYDDLGYGRIDAMASGRLLGNIYEAQGDLDAARKLYQEVLGHGYPADMPVSVLNEIREHFKGRLERLARGESNVAEQDKPGAR